MKLGEAVALRIKTLLHERKLTQYELAKLSGVSRQTISTVIKGQRNQVSLKTVCRIAVAFGMSPSQFFDDTIFKDLQNGHKLHWNL